VFGLTSTKSQVREGQEKDVTMRFLEDGVRAFRDDSQVGIVQVEPGLQSSHADGPMKLAPHVDFSHPIMLRRKLFLEMGGLQCLQERCFSAGVMQLSESMWRHGLRVGMVGSGAVANPGASPFRSDPELPTPIDCPRPPNQKERIAMINAEIISIELSRDPLLSPARPLSDREAHFSLCFAPDRGSVEVNPPNGGAEILEWS
jgi:hypothetical protein